MDAQPGGKPVSRVPLVLITGFLGAGKTTFLRALMTALQARQTDFSVVVNDFENAEVDATRLRSSDAIIRAINGSCVCCSSLHEFMAVLGDIEVPRGGVLLVEVNGASDVMSLIAAITARHECRRFTSPLQVTVADAQRWQKRGPQDELEREQVQTATHSVITHVEEVNEERLAQVRAAVKELSPRAVECSAESLADYLRLVAATARLARQDEPQQTPLLQPAIHHHHHDGERAFTSMRVDLPFVVKRADLEQVLRELPEEVVRVKGLCRLAEIPTVPLSFQHVRPQAETWFLPLLGTQGIVPTGVIIGVGLPAEEISAQFQRLPAADLLPDYQP